MSETYTEYQLKEHVQPHTRLVTLVTQIVAALTATSGSTWSIVNKRYRADADVYERFSKRVEVTGTDSEAFSISYAYMPGKPEARLEISGSYPRFADGVYIEMPYGDADTSKITVAATRPPEAIAKEIYRRFLPEYRRVLALKLKRKQDTDNYQSKLATNTDHFAKLVGQEISDENRKGGRFRLYRNSLLEQLSGEIKVHGDNTVTLELSNLPFSIAERILNLVKA